MIVEYAVGFYFDRSREHVWLIRKARPDWQAGKLNGIGGKVEPGESVLQAMRREFEEEARARVADWVLIASLRDAANAWRVGFFRATARDDREFLAPRQMTDEPIAPFRVRDLVERRNLVRGLLVILALARDESCIRKPVLLIENTIPWVTPQ